MTQEGISETSQAGLQTIRGLSFILLGAKGALSSIRSSPAQLRKAIGLGSGTSLNARANPEVLPEFYKPNQCPSHEKQMLFSSLAKLY